MKIEKIQIIIKIISGIALGCGLFTNVLLGLSSPELFQEFRWTHIHYASIRPFISSYFRNLIHHSFDS